MTDRTKSVALLVSDGLRFTEKIDDEKIDDVIYVLQLIIRGDVTDEEERDFFRRMLDNRWTVTAPFPANANP